MNIAKIIAVTEPKLKNAVTVDEFIAYVARISNPENQHSSDTAPRLLKYLIKNKHWSPFEMVNIVMDITTTRDIARQVLRHRSFSFQEFSQRYANPTVMGFTTREARLQDKSNRQNSIDIVHDELNLMNAWNDIQQDIIDKTTKAYDWAVDAGIAKEQARAVLPEGLITSRMYMNGTLRSWIHYCQIRMANGTQKEHRQLASSAWEEILKVFPSLEDLEK